MEKGDASLFEKGDASLLPRWRNGLGDAKKGTRVFFRKQNFRRSVGRGRRSLVAKTAYLANAFIEKPEVPYAR
jgi:hypothetical protein